MKELLKKILDTGWLNNELSCEVEELLTQPEPFKPDWANYRQGVADSKREPLSDEEIYNHCCAMDSSYTCNFIDGVEWAEQQHGIGGE